MISKIGGRARVWQELQPAGGRDGVGEGFGGGRVPLVVSSVPLPYSEGGDLSVLTHFSDEEVIKEISVPGL